jgi:HlyD family secretion protein
MLGSAKTFFGSHPLRKKLTWALIGLSLLILAFALFRYRSSRREPKVQFETSEVERGRIVAKVTATGTLSALVTVQVGSQVSGRIQQILVDFNSPVKKGQVIAKLDPQLFQAALEQVRANFLAAQSNLKKAKVQAAEASRQYQRIKGLADQNLIAQAELDTAQANFEVAQSQVESLAGTLEQARAALHQAEVNLAYTTIVSPIDGIVVSRNVDVGQTVAASLQAPTLFVLAEDLRKMQVNTSVSESDVGKLQPQMPATFVVDAYPSERFTGVIRQIRNAPQTVQNVVTYDAVIDIDNAELKLKPGMTANVTFIYAEKADALRVPNAALRFRPPGELLTKPAPLEPRDRRTIWVLENSVPRPVSIKTGITDGSLTEVVEGNLVEGQLVITESVGESAPSRSGPSGQNPFRRMF